MSQRLVGWLVWIAAFVIGSVLGFFSAGPALFGDGGGYEQILILAISTGVYAVIALVLTLVSPSGWKITATLLAVPVVFVALLFGRETPVMGLAFVLNAFASAFLGAWLAILVRARKRAA